MPVRIKRIPVDMQAVTPDILASLIRYDEVSGLLFWRERPVEMFADSDARSPDWLCRSWNAKHAGKEALCAITKRGHKRGRLFGKGLLAHRAAWAIYYGQWPQYTIDHINGNPADNRIANLRDVSHQENCKNQKIPKSNRSGTIGVYWSSRNGKWIAVIRVNGKIIYLGSFGLISDAANARKMAEAQYGYHSNHGRNTEVT